MDTQIDATALKGRLKQLMVENLMLNVTAAEIGDTQALFGPNSLGLDSVDGLQLVVMLEKNFGLKIADADLARHVLQSVDRMAEAIQNRAPAQGG